MSHSYTELSATLVAAQAKTKSMKGEEICQSLEQVFETLFDLHRLERQSVSTPLLGTYDLDTLRQHPHTSISQQHVTCLECGEAYQLLNGSHLKRHGLTSRSYKQKWNLPLTQALCARRYHQLRRRQALALDLGRHLIPWQTPS